MEDELIAINLINMDMYSKMLIIPAQQPQTGICFEILTANGLALCSSEHLSSNIHIQQSEKKQTRGLSPSLVPLFKLGQHFKGDLCVAILPKNLRTVP